MQLLDAPTNYTTLEPSPTDYPVYPTEYPVATDYPVPSSSPTDLPTTYPTVTVYPTATQTSTSTQTPTQTSTQTSTQTQTQPSTPTLAPTETLTQTPTETPTSASEPEAVASNLPSSYTEICEATPPAEAEVIQKDKNSDTALPYLDTDLDGIEDAADYDICTDQYVFEKKPECDTPGDICRMAEKVE